MILLPSLRVTTFVWTVAISLCVAVVITGSLSFVSIRNAEKMETAWSDFAKKSSEKSLLLTQVRGLLGFDGMIHHFKNYVLRKERMQGLSVQQKLLQLSIALTAYEHVGLDEREKPAFQALLAAAVNYKNAFVVAETMVDAGQTSVEIDRAVKIDDTATIKAIETLDNYVLEISLRSTKAVTESVQDRILLSRLTGIVLTVLLLSLAVFIIWFVQWRLARPLGKFIDAFDQVDASTHNLLHLPIERSLRGTELGALAQAFNHLAERLSESKSELDFQKATLDEHAIVSIADVRGNISYVNDKFCNISGYSREELLGQNHRMVKSDEHSPEFYGELWRTIANGDVWNGEIKNIKKGGQFYWVDATIVPFLNEQGKPFQYVAIRTDITDRVKAKEEADHANRAKSEFLSSMSHELRTPLNAILGFAQVLNFDPQAPLSSDQKSSVDQIVKGGKHLLVLINDILDLSQIEAGEVSLSLEDVSAKAIIDDCLILIETTALHRGIEITLGEGFATEPGVHTDYTRLKQSLLNLMSNAVKYNRVNGKVTVDCQETKTGMLRISVTDTGEGIPENMLEELFQPFNRLGAENTEVEGTGIGLVITKQLVEAMGGLIGVDSQVGVGTTFWIEVPLRKIEPTDTCAHKAQDLIESGKLLPNVSGIVLYVEDNPANLQLMEVIIGHVEGLTMISAHNAELGIELAKSKNPNMIVMDINLPGMNGFAALKILKDMEETRDIPVIALSANAMENDIRKGMKSGFQRYLTKPIDVEEVVAAIKEIIEE
jgi:PAS domain S-box-containing protein